jgi:hypothetical protein
MTMRHRTPWLALVLLAACFGNPGTLGLPCVEPSACFDGLECRDGVCMEPSAASTGASTDSGDGDGGDGDADTGDGDGGDGDGEAGDGDGDNGDGDGDTTGDGDGDAGDGDGDGDGAPFCGNGIREGGENCDGNDLGDSACIDFGYGGGLLTCTDDCQLDPTECCLSEGQECIVLANECCDDTMCLDLFPPAMCGPGGG